MKSPGGNVLRIAGPFRAFIQRFAFALLVVAAFGLMMLGRLDNDLVARTQIAIVDFVTPVMDVVSRPVAAAHRVADGIRDTLHLRNEIARLREENTRLMQWQIAARRLDAENAQFRAELGVKADIVPTFITARVIADSGGPFVRTILLNAGHRDGIKQGQAVTNARGVIGRVATVGARSSRVLLLSDFNSRVPITVSDARYRGVLSGDNSERPQVVFMSNQARVEPGDRIVTSGDGGMMPPGLPVGTVVSIKDGLIRVQPYVDWHRLEFVQVVRYELPRLQPAGNEAPLAEPNALTRTANESATETEAAVEAQANPVIQPIAEPISDFIAVDGPE